MKPRPDAWATGAIVMLAYGDSQLAEGVFNAGVDVAQPRVHGERQFSAVAQQPDALDAPDRDAAHDGSFIRPGGQVQVDVAATVFPYTPG